MKFFKILKQIGNHWSFILRRLLFYLSFLLIMPGAFLLDLLFLLVLFVIITIFYICYAIVYLLTGYKLSKLIDKAKAKYSGKAWFEELRYRLEEEFYTFAYGMVLMEKIDEILKAHE